METLEVLLVGFSIFGWFYLGILGREIDMARTAGLGGDQSCVPHDWDSFEVVMHLTIFLIGGPLMYLAAASSSAPAGRRT